MCVSITPVERVDTLPEMKGGEGELQGYSSRGVTLLTRLRRFSPLLYYP